MKKKKYIFRHKKDIIKNKTGRTNVYRGNHSLI